MQITCSPIPKDSVYAGRTIASWAERYLTTPKESSSEDEVVARLGKTGLRTDLLINGKAFIADEPADVGGSNLGPTPYDFLTAGLGACTAMTLRLYANHKKWPLDAVEVKLSHEKIHARIAKPVRQKRDE